MVVTASASCSSWLRCLTRSGRAIARGLAGGLALSRLATVARESRSDLLNLQSESHELGTACSRVPSLGRGIRNAGSSLVPVGRAVCVSLPLNLHFYELEAHFLDLHRAALRR